MVPRFTEFYIPVLQVMSDIEPIEINTLIDKVADHINLSDEDKQVLTESGTQYRYRSNINWAVTDLSQGNFIERVKRGNYVITLSGLELLEENFEKIDRDFLAARSESFRAFMEKKGTRKGKKTVENESICDSKKEMDACKNQEVGSSEVSLDELYSIRETLKKVKISTYDVDTKIKELENEYFFNALLPRLSKLIPEALCDMNESVSFTVEYIPEREISIKRGNSKRTIKYRTGEKGKILNNSFHDKAFGKKQEKSTNVIGKESEEAYSEETILEGQNPSAINSNLPQNKGVWIEPYKDRMIIVKGDTEPFSDLFVSYGGRIIKNTIEGWNGWIFMSNREEGLRADLSGYLIVPPNKNESDSYPISLSENTDTPIETISSSLISKYMELLNSLRSFNFLGITGPHKAIMLISIFNGIRNGLFQENKIKFSSELESIYNENWNLYVGGSPTLGAVYPFVHLGRESFFIHKLIRPIIDYDKTWSRHSLDRHIDYALMDKKLVDLVKNQTIHNKFVDFLRDKYCHTNENRSKHLIKTKSEHPLNAFTANQTPLNLMEAFRKFSLETPAKHGKLYSKRSVQVYVNSLITDSMKDIVSEFKLSGNVFSVNDLRILSEIKQKVDELSLIDKTLLTSRSALSLYIKFIQTITQKS